VTQDAGQELALPPAQVEELMQTLAKAQRAHQLYLPNNPVYQQAIERLREQFRRLWEATDDLFLDVSENELRWEGSVVYNVTTKSESIAWVLFKDGVRSLTFKPGVEQDEIVSLLDVIHRARTLQAEDNDDLLTLLWEKDFQRIQYQFQDLTTDTGTMQLPTEDQIQPPETSPTAVQQAVEEEAPPRREGIVRTEDFDTTLYFLDEREIEFIRKSVEDEYTQDLRRNVLGMLFDVLELQPYPTVRAELISILESFLPYLLGASDFGAVAYVLRESKAVLTRAREVLPEHRQALEALPTRLSEEQTLTQLLQSLDEATVHPSAQELTELFNELKADALPTLFGWLPRLVNARVKETVEVAVQRLANANSAAVVQAIQLPDPVVALEAIKVAGRLRLQPAVQGLAAVLASPETPVRVAAVQALSEIASPAAIQALEKGLDDDSRDVRLASVRVIGQHKSKSALPKIAEVVQGKSMRAADLTEKMAFYEAYGTMIGETGVAALDAMLNSGGFLKRKEDPQTRACAAMALGRIGTPAARAALEKAAQEKDPLVRNAVNRALRGDRASTMIRAGEIPT
jgi:HEAT repeat protein